MLSSEMNGASGGIAFWRRCHIPSGNDPLQSGVAGAEDLRDQRWCGMMASAVGRSRGGPSRPRSPDPCPRAPEVHGGAGPALACAARRGHRRVQVLAPRSRDRLDVEPAAAPAAQHRWQEALPDPDRTQAAEPRLEGVASQLAAAVVGLRGDLRPPFLNHPATDGLGAPRPGAASGSAPRRSGSRICCPPDPRPGPAPAGRSS